MNSEWKAFLENAGAEFDASGVSDYGNLPRELSVAITGNVFADLSHYGLIAIHGEDAEAFLQGQLTNDIRRVDEQHSQLSGYCNPKGRLLAIFRIFRRGDSYYLCLPGEMVEELIKRLRMFVLRSKVTIDDASDSFIHLGVSGTDAELDLRAFTGTVPDTVHEVFQNDEQLLIRVPGIHPSFEIFTNTARATALWERLNVRSAPIGATAWQLLDIQAGIPMIYPATREAFVPQMTNLQLVDGVSFKKGCYPGQEIVARTQYLGKLKRRMYKARVDSNHTPTPGEDIFADAEPDQSAGQLVSAAPHPDGGFVVLAVLKIAGADGADLHLGAVDGPPLRLEQLPYPFAEA
ncbi:MAG: folate-binding protein YgfZ [Thiogranum sp.]|nr:folate-binding protein YgfZ [Thiogranum sp.]